MKSTRRTPRRRPARGSGRSRRRRSASWPERPDEPRDRAAPSRAETSSPRGRRRPAGAREPGRSTVATDDCDQDEVGDRDAVVRIDVARQRRQRAVRHPDRHRRHVLERIGHRKQQEVHFFSISRGELSLMAAGPHPRRQLTLMPRSSFTGFRSAWPQALLVLWSELHINDRPASAADPGSRS